MSAQTSVIVKQESDYYFSIHYGDGLPVQYGDEPPPLGQNKAPNPTHFLLAAVANCLSYSLLFACRKYKQHIEPIHTEVLPVFARNEAGRSRIESIHAHLHLGVAADTVEYLEKILEQFESFCTVSQSVGKSIPIHITVSDVDDKIVRASTLKD
jgi:uncharacterized OsmC-like protein